MASQVGGMNNGQPQVLQDAGPTGPQATEYTLQGVMRFLQMEWHSHERARNSWDIERAEMKAKIAKQEGEIRLTKRLNDQLDRQLRMLESALRRERSKSSMQKEETQSGQASPKPGASNSPSVDFTSLTSPVKPSPIKHNSFMLVADTAETQDEQDQYRDKSKRYLEQCMQEVQYLLSPPPHPIPAKPLDMPNGAYTGLVDPPPTMPEPLPRNSQLMPSFPNSNFSHMTSNHPSQHNSTIELSTASRRSVRSPRMLRQALPIRQGQSSTFSALSDNVTSSLEEPVELVTHTFDASGQPVADSNPDVRTRPNMEDDADDWNFEEQQSLVVDRETPSSIARRPDTDAFPSATIDMPTSPRPSPGSGRRRTSGTMSRRRSSESGETHDSGVDVNGHDPPTFKVRFALRGHLDVVRSVISTGGGSPSEPEICTAGDDGTIKRWIIPASYGNLQNGQMLNDLDIASYFTHRGHEGIITCLASCPSTNYSTGGRASGDGWIFSGGQDATVRIWERGRVDPKATLDGHTDAVWTVCVLPGTSGSIFGASTSISGGADRIVIASGSADGTVKVWTVSSPPQMPAPSGARRGVGGGRRHSVTSGSNHPSSPQPNTATSTPCQWTLIHTIARPLDVVATPTCIIPLSPNGENFVVSYTDSSILVFDTKTGEELIGMASNETYDGTTATSINSIVANRTATAMVNGGQSWSEMTESNDRDNAAAPTGTAQGVEGVIVSGHEDRYIRFFDANSGQCTYTMLAHPGAISALSLSPDGHEAVSAGHDSSIRFWSLDKRICTQEITCHRPMRGEGVCSVVWSQDGRYVVSGGGDGVVKVFAR